MTGEEQEDNDLFTHLTYLSQLSNDVSKHQQIEQESPGDYKIKLLDSSSASPSSSNNLRNQSATPQRGRRVSEFSTPHKSVPFDYDSKTAQVTT